MSVLTAALVLAASPSPVPSPTEVVIDESRATPGLWGLFFFVALGVAVWILYKSLSKQLGRVTFDEDAVNGGPEPDAPEPAAADSPEQA